MDNVTCDEGVPLPRLSELNGGERSGLGCSVGRARRTVAGKSSEVGGAAVRNTGTGGGGQPQLSGTEVSI